MRPSKEPRLANRSDSILIFLLALAAGFLNWWLLRRNPFLSHPIIDAAEYLAGARAILAGLPYGEVARIHGPLYPLFLVPFVRGFSSPLPAIYVAQIFLTALAAVLVRGAGVRLGGRTLGNAAGILLALAPPMLYFEVQALPVSLQVLLHALLILFLLRRGREGTRALLWAGICGGLSYLAHPGSGVFLLLVLLVLLLREKPRRRALSFAFGLVLPLAPISVFHAAAGEGVLPGSRNAGLNFYIGNGPGSDGTAHVRPGYEWERLTSLPLREGLRGSGEVNRFFFGKAFDEWRRDPSSAVRRVAAKALLFGSGFPIDASQDFAFFREESPLLRASFLDAGVLVPLALGFLASGAARGPDWFPAALGFAGYWFGTALTVFAIRYRAPAWPFLALLAPALALSGSRVSRGGVTRAAALAIALLLAAHADPFGYRDVNPVRTEYNLGRMEYERGNLDRARARFESMWRRSGDPDAANALGVVEMAEPAGAERAMEWFGKALLARDDYADARYNRALLLGRTGREAEAMGEVTEAIRLAPAHAPALYLRGVLFEKEGRPDEAAASYRESLGSDPTRDDAWSALGVLLARRGEWGEAEKCFLRALRLDPRSAGARENLYRVRSAIGSKAR